MSSSAGYETFFSELMYSHALIFCGNTESKAIAAQFEGGIDLAVVKKFDARTEFRFEDFPIYGTRLQNIIRKKTEWQPQNVWQLFKRPYADTITYYGFWFAFVFGCLSVVNLIVAIVAAVPSWLALKHS